jgi:Na+-driven multidrug efflux pump
MVSFPFYWVYVVLETNGGAVRGMGYTFYSMIAVITNMCVLRVALLAIFSRVFNTIESLAACYPISWGTAAITFMILFQVIVNKKIRQYEPSAA